MSISEDEKMYLVEQLENSRNRRPFFYLKFCSSEKFAQDVCDGNLYANTPEFFRQKEIQTGEHGQGDKFDSMLSLQTENIRAINDKTRELIFSIPNGISNIRFIKDDSTPIVCFVGIPFRDMKFHDFDKDHITFTLPFTNEEYDTMKDRFGEYCVILRGRELEIKTNEFVNKNGCDHIFEKIEYCVSNSIDRINDFIDGTHRRFLYKNHDLDYQREYRMVFGMEMPKKNFIEIGKISSAQIVKSNKLKDIMFCIDDAFELKQ